MTADEQRGGSMLERVARAIWASEWDEELPPAGYVQHALAVQMARAAIEAMRAETLVYRQDGQVVHEQRGGWRDIATAPKDGSEILVWREDCGVLLARFTSLGEFLTDAELEAFDEDTTYYEDWFYADFISGGRMEGEEAPTHWQPLPAPPTPSQPGQHDAPGMEL